MTVDKYIYRGGIMDNHPTIKLIENQLLPDVPKEFGRLLICFYRHMIIM